MVAYHKLARSWFFRDGATSQTWWLSEDDHPVCAFVARGHLLWVQWRNWRCGVILWGHGSRAVLRTTARWMLKLHADTLSIKIVEMHCVNWHRDVKALKTSRRGLPHGRRALQRSLWKLMTLPRPYLIWVHIAYEYCLKARSYAQ